MTQLKLMNSLWIEWRKQGIVKEYIFISDDFHLHDNDKKLWEDVGGEDLQGQHPDKPRALQQPLRW